MRRRRCASASPAVVPVFSQDAIGRSSEAGDEPLRDEVSTHLRVASPRQEVVCRCETTYVHGAPTAGSERK